MAKLLYFAWVRQKTGKAEEEIALAAGVNNVHGLIDQLIQRGENYAEAFRNPQSIRCAINQEHKNFDAEISDGDEIAFFPPVTGGTS